MVNTLSFYSPGRLPKAFASIWRNPALRTGNLTSLVPSVPMCRLLQSRPNTARSFQAATTNVEDLRRSRTFLSLYAPVGALSLRDPVPGYVVEMPTFIEICETGGSWRKPSCGPGTGLALQNGPKNDRLVCRPLSVCPEAASGSRRLIDYRDHGVPNADRHWTRCGVSATPSAGAPPIAPYLT